VRLISAGAFSGDGSVYHSDRGVFLEYYSKSRRLIEDVPSLLIESFADPRKTTAIGTRACKIQITDKDQILFCPAHRLFTRLATAAARGKGAADTPRNRGARAFRHPAGGLGGRGTAAGLAD
jgi:hypothetical protein